MDTLRRLLSQPLKASLSILELILLATATIFLHPVIQFPLQAAYNFALHIIYNIRSILNKRFSDKLAEEFKIPVRFITPSPDNRAKSSYLLLPFSPLTSSDFDNIFKDEEPQSEYTYGGYCAIRLTESLKKKRYKGIKKMGWNKSSTTWLALDTYHKHTNQKYAIKSHRKYVALKILRADISPVSGAAPPLPKPPNLPQPSLEPAILKKIRSMKTSSPNHPGVNHLPDLLDKFEHSSVFGRHVVLVLPIIGPSVPEVKELLYKEVCPPPTLTKLFARDILTALEFLHNDCGLIHTDITFDKIRYPFFAPDAAIDKYLSKNPNTYGVSKFSYDYVVSESFCNKENIKFVEPRLILDGFDNACWSHKHGDRLIQSMLLRAPEVIFEVLWDEKVDIWNFGLLLHEFSGFGVLFDGQGTDMWIECNDGNRAGRKTLVLPEADQVLLLDQITALIGGVPARYFSHSTSRFRHIFMRNGILVDKHRRIVESGWQKLPSLIDYKVNTMTDRNELGPRELKAVTAWYKDFLTFVGQAVAYKHNRSTASRLLKHAWLSTLDHDIGMLRSIWNGTRIRFGGRKFGVINLFRDVPKLSVVDEVMIRRDARNKGKRKKG
ncbi:hypothetical protein ABW19_dt0208383 [Dactylella cylindrospora]|nr:hypothetical protein ABW19_dt0208383 [Dactylella cylindrospora]